MSTLTLKANTTHHILSGALAGLIGGAVFGVLMTGMLRWSEGSWGRKEPSSV